ncbi:MAG: molybdopterin-binding protein [Beijerinckiaceae bacterium]|jgi:molybdenum cofactor cytidylyltransferase|nr:molybdopterin-binding protein [Beijerinckiaceae bacterium]
MFFGTVPVREAEGGVLAHKVRAGEKVLPKGHGLTTADCASLAAAGVAEVTIARLSPGDVPEDEAARLLAGVAAGEGVRCAEAFTGRVNLFAEADGLLLLDEAAIHAFNAADEGMTLATLLPFRRVKAGEMVATVKIIPFALPGAVVEAGRQALAVPPIRVAAFRPKRVGLILLSTPDMKPSVLAKTARITAERVASLGGEIAFEQRLPHRQAALVDAMQALDPAAFDILIIFGAAAISDRRDVIPAALAQTGGRIVHLGMPVDPGNLLLLAEWAGKPALGAPGCARSPAENGFDWVLERLFADLPVTSREIRAMGVGGLLMEIISRPQPRAGEEM